MICKNCGAEMPENEKICPACNSDLSECEQTVETETEQTVDMEECTVKSAESETETESADDVSAETEQEESEETESDTESEDATVSADEPATEPESADDADDEIQHDEKKYKGLTLALAIVSVIAAVSLVFNALFATGVIKPPVKTSKPVAEETVNYQFATAIEIGDIKVSNAQFDYYYSMSYQYFQQMEMSYQQQGMIWGFPLDKAPDEVLSGMKNDDGVEMYYDEVLAEYSATLVYQQMSLYNEAKAEGYALTEDEKAQIDEIVASIEKQAAEEDLSIDEFIKEYYSAGLDEESVRELIEVELIASRYYDDLQTKAVDGVTDAQVEAEYRANPQSYADYSGNVADVRHCLIMFENDATEKEKKAAYKEAEKIKKEFEKAGGTEEAFIEIVKKYNEDTASTESGGLYEGITAHSNYVKSFKDWAVDPSRKAGDCAIVETEYGYHIMYYVKNNGPEWKTVILEKLQQEAAEAAFNALVGENGKYKMVKNEEVIAGCADAFCAKLKEELA